MKKKILIAAIAAVVILLTLGITVSATEGSPTAGEPAARVYACNLIMGNQVYIEYAVEVSGAENAALTDVGLLIWREGTATRTPETADADIKSLRKVSIAGVECYVAEYTELSAKEMTDMVTAQPYVIVDGQTYYGESMDYSICTYAERKLGLVDGVAGTTDQKLVATLRDMLHYGASAQLYFNYKTDKLATYILEGRVNVTYELNIDDGVTVDNPNPISYEAASGKVKLLPLTAKGYTFMGWCVDTADGWEEITEVDTSAAGDITLIAMWSLDHYSITYKNTMGVFNDNEDTYTVTDWINLRPLEKYDYTFNGWRYDNAYGEFVGEDGIPAGTTGNITLYADWTLKPDFENLLYVVDDEYNLPNGQKFCMLTGVLDSTVTKVEISSLFNHIKEGAFEDCHWLEELSLPYLGSDYTTSNYTNVGYLFGYANNAEAEGAIPTSLSKLTVTGGAVGDYAFANLKNVTEIVLSPEVTSIGYKAFLNCANLEELTMPLLYVNYNTREDARKSEGKSEYTQGYYYGLPGSVHDYHYDYEGKTYKLHINGGGVYHGTANDMSWETAGTTLGNGFGKYIFELCRGISEVTIDNITVIPQYTFKECTNLKKVTIGDAVQDIRAGAFMDSAIEEIEIPDSVKEIGEFWDADGGYTYKSFAYTGCGGVFLNCQNLKRAVIGNGVENIPTYTFWNCKNLEEIIIGKNVRFVDDGAFRDCNDTFTVINNSEQKEWVVSGLISERFMTQLMASENAPEKVYYGDGGFQNKQAVDAFTEEQIKNWHLVFYSPTDPYADGSASSDLEYWYHDDGADWYKKQYTVTPKLWPKPTT